LCCCNVLLTSNNQPTPGALLSVKVANTGVLPDPDSFIKRRVYLAPELLAALPATVESGIPSPHSYFSPSVSSSSPYSRHTPSLLSMCSSECPTVLFTKESDVYALGITLLQVFRHTLDDCAPDICKVAAEKRAGGLRVPCFPKDRSSSFSTLPEILRDIISSCTMRDSRARPSSAEIRSVSNFIASTLSVFVTMLFNSYHFHFLCFLVRGWTSFRQIASSICLRIRLIGCCCSRSS
jgi:serine/threonine protein kinase